MNKMNYPNPYFTFIVSDTGETVDGTEWSEDTHSASVQVFDSAYDGKVLKLILENEENELIRLE